MNSASLALPLTVSTLSTLFILRSDPQSTMRAASLTLPARRLQGSGSA